MDIKFQNIFVVLVFSNVQYVNLMFNIELIKFTNLLNYHFCQTRGFFQKRLNVIFNDGGAENLTNHV